MHLSEFKAWFEGFTDGMDGVPSLKQWAPTPIFIDRYVRPYRPYWGDTVWCSTAKNQNILDDGHSVSVAAPSLADWSSAGKAEYLSMRA